MIDSKIAFRCFSNAKIAFMERRGRLEVAGVAQDRQVGNQEVEVKRVKNGGGYKINYSHIMRIDYILYVLR